ncbi:TDT family transporter [Acidothermaceae bacterium B102]|nr:TDT family transporter [Acidothermaceae bacterium B102]
MTMTAYRPVSTPHRPPLLAGLGPNWFASVMGTGIIATAAVSLPHQVRGLHTFALAVWLLAVVMLIVLTSATVAHWARHPLAARSHLLNPVMVHFYGAPPMAVLTVGAGTLLLGRDLIGLRLALDIDWVLWTIGTVAGLACAAVVPYVAFTRHDNPPDAAFGGWLMPVVPPMVSATTGALLIGHLSAGQLRETLIALCYSMFGLSLAASAVVITLVWGRLAVHGVGAAALVPTLWILLGPVGQSITAANGLGNVASVRYEPGAKAFGLLYGLGAWGFALLWLGIATAITARTVRSGLPFGLPWWSFTFPLGTVVTGTSALAARTGLEVFSWSAVALYLVLVSTWLIVLIRTGAGARSLLR